MVNKPEFLISLLVIQCLWHIQSHYTMPHGVRHSKEDISLVIFLFTNCNIEID